MSESIGQRLARGAAATTFAVVSLSGSAPVEHAERPSGYGTCYDTPDAQNGNRPTIDLVPYQYAAGSPRKWDAGTTPLVTVTENSERHIVENPGPLPGTIEQKVRGAAVKITRSKSSGSGFIVEDRYGERVVVTAAHVAPPEEITQVEIIDHTGKTSKVAGGCYVYGGEKINDSMRNPAEQVDIAILRLNQELGSTTLKLAATAPERGSWVSFYNFQQKRAVTDPARYNGLVMGQQSPIMDNMVITGFEGERDERRSEHTLQPGASGGVAVDRSSGEVAFMSVSAMRVGSREALRDYCGIKIDQKDRTYFTNMSRAVVAGVVDVDNIRYTLEHGNY